VNKHNWPRFTTNGQTEHDLSRSFPILYAIQSKFFEVDVSDREPGRRGAHIHRSNKLSVVCCLYYVYPVSLNVGYASLVFAHDIRLEVENFRIEDALSCSLLVEAARRQQALQLAVHDGISK
jgi:hypothetical protein